MAAPLPHGYFDDLDDADAILILRLQLEDTLQFTGHLEQIPGAEPNFTNERLAFHLAGLDMIRSVLELRDHAIAEAFANSDQMNLVHGHALVAQEPGFAIQDGKTSLYHSGERLIYA